MTQRSLAIGFAALLLAFLVPSVSAQSTSRDVYNLGVQLYQKQEYAQALALFEKVLAVKPGDPYTRSYISKCKTAIANNVGKKNDLEGQLAEIRIPQIEFKDAPIGDVLDFLAQRAEEITQGKVVPNFIYKGTTEQRKGTTVSITLRNVPMTEAIRYIGQLTRTHFSYEEHAIVADPNYKAAPHPALEKAAAAEASKPATVFGEPAKNIFD